MAVEGCCATGTTRIWWIGVGLMVKAPIHAAAKFKKGRVHMTTHQYCVPSYTSTMRYVEHFNFRDLENYISSRIHHCYWSPCPQPREQAL